MTNKIRNATKQLSNLGQREKKKKNGSSCTHEYTNTMSEIKRDIEK